ncbi:MAG: hypothetical protein KKC66_04320 [Candidatus Omnitrophica bacterium]|nr:hypothetical protein [Candidatus Omnitrophota bacterium]
MRKLPVILLFFFLIFYFSSEVFPQEDKDVISVDFRDTEIGDALRLLSKQHNLNIIISEYVKGPITAQFSNVTVQEAIDAIVTINGYAYTKRGNVIKVTSPEAAELEPAVTRLFKLNNATASELKESFAKVLSETGNIEIDERSNALIVTDNSKVIEKIQELIEGLDGITPQIMIEAKVIETILSDSDRLGIDWTTQITATGANRPTTFPFDRKSQGGRWFPVGDATADAGDNAGTFPPDPATGFPLALPSNFTLGSLDFTQLQAVLEILESRSNTTTLSNPKIVTMNNKEASVLVGTRMPIPIYERNEATGTFEITGYDEEKVGVSLKVVPQVNSQGYIKLKLSPEVSSITSYTGPNNERPIISTRQAQTEVQIKDGHTVVIGGLIKEENIKTVRRVPILGHIPILSLLFKKTEDTKGKTDLLIFVTAHIISEDKAKSFTQEAIYKSKRPDLFPEEKQKKNLKPKKETTEAKSYKPLK